MGSSGYSITISAVDAATAKIAKINKGLAAMRAPADRLRKQFSTFTSVSGLDKVAGGFNQITSSAISTARAMERTAGPLGVITSATSIAGVYQMSQAWAQWGNNLGNTSARLNLSAQQLDRFQGAATIGGVSVEAMTAGLKGLNQTMFDAIGGRNPEAVAFFNTIGVAFDDGTRHARKLDAVLPEVIDKIAGIRDPAAQARAAVHAFGEAGEDLLPIIKLGAAGFKELQDRAASYGVTTQGAIEDSRRLNTQFQIGKLAAEKFGEAFSRRLEPTITPLLQWWSNEVRILTNDLNGLSEAADETAYQAERRAALSPERQAQYDAMKAKRALGGSGGAVAPTQIGAGAGLSLSAREARIRDGLAADLGITGNQAAGIVSGLVAESGLQAINEKNPIVPGSRGGFGWAQWTGPRRRDFEVYAASHHLDPKSDAANYGFFVQELTTKYPGVLKNIRAAGDARGAANAFFPYESGGDPGLEHDRAAHVANADRVAALPPGGAGGKLDVNINVNGAGVKSVTSAARGPVNTPRVATSGVGLTGLSQWDNAG